MQIFNQAVQLTNKRSGHILPHDKNKIAYVKKQCQKRSVKKIKNKSFKEIHTNLNNLKRTFVLEKKQHFIREGR